jgi:hypothetical protein
VKVVGRGGCAGGLLIGQGRRWPVVAGGRGPASGSGSLNGARVVERRRGRRGRGDATVRHACGRERRGRRQRQEAQRRAQGKGRGGASSVACTWGSSSVPVAGSATSRPSDAAVDAARGARGRARALGHGKRVAGWQRKEEETGRRRKEEKKRRGEKEKGRRK